MPRAYALAQTAVRRLLELGVVERLWACAGSNAWSSYAWY